MKRDRISKFIYLSIVLALISSSFVILNKLDTVQVIGQEDPKEFYEKPKTSQDYRPFSVATTAFYTLELVDALDSASTNVLEQVVETLFAINLSDLDLPRINLLAESYHWADALTLQIKLREGILFHDGTPFNASAAKWNLDRLRYLTNCTGTNTGKIARTQSLWFLPDGVTPIMNSIVSDGAYNITITLNTPHASILDTLTCINAGMISPTAHAGDVTSFISLTGDICGTGPFVYDGYLSHERVDFYAYENYWRGRANISEMAYIIFDDTRDAHRAFLTDKIDFNNMFLDSNLPIYDLDPELTVYRFTEETGKPSLKYHYLGYNNQKYNRTWRKAMSYAINYSYVIEELQSGSALRAYNAFSPSFGGVFNESLLTDPNVIPNNGDIEAARATMQSMGFGVGFSEGDWANQATLDPFLTVLYHYTTDNTFKENLGSNITDWFEKIGVAVEKKEISWSEFLEYIFEDKDQLGLFVISWAPDYIGPYTLLHTLFNPLSENNFAQVNDTKLNTLIASSSFETDDTLRNEIYKNIQGYIATKGYFHAPLYHSKVVYTYTANVFNFPHNAMNRLYFYPCEWIPQLVPLPSKIFVDDLDPNFNWTRTSLENEWCTGSGTRSDPYVIRDLVIDGSMYNGIEIHNSNVYFEIENCTIYNSDYGILLYKVNNSLIYNNTIYESDYGISLSYTNNSLIYSNIIHNTLYRCIELSQSNKNSFSFNLFRDGVGINLEWSNDNSFVLNRICNISSPISIRASDHSIINQNQIIDCHGGIVCSYNHGTLISGNNLTRSGRSIKFSYSHNNTISHNFIFGNEGGISLYDTDETTIKGNRIIQNLYGGLSIGGDEPYVSQYNQIIDNDFINNTGYGAQLSTNSVHNKIYLNSFIGNSFLGSSTNAVDTGTLNDWDNGTIGNYWDDYVGVDANDDGIGDTPYLIDGTAGSMDNYPIFKIVLSIKILKPYESSIFATSPPDYNIEIIEFDLDSVWYTMDDGVNNITITSFSGILDQSIWEVLPDGLVTITFYANDTMGNMGIAQVTIYKDSITPLVTINEPETGDEFTTIVPLYDIDVTEVNLDTIWYTMNDGLNSTIITSDIGILDESIWNTLLNGPVALVFYANDTAGNVGHEIVIIYKRTPTPTIPPGIPGPNVFLVFFMTFLCIISLSWKSLKKIRLNLL